MCVTLKIKTPKLAGCAVRPACFLVRDFCLLSYISFHTGAFETGNGNFSLLRLKWVVLLLHVLVTKIMLRL